MSDQFIGEIRMTGFSYAPPGWALCNGQLMPINQNQALYAVIGVNFGGDGVSTFGLPDLRGRVPVHQGTGVGLTARTMGQKSGAETVTLLTSQIPAHTHSLMAFNDDADTKAPGGNFLAVTASQTYSTATTPDIAMDPLAVGTVGGGSAHQNMQPFQVVSFMIATTGLFPTRN